MDVDLKGNTVKAELSGSGLMTCKRLCYLNGCSRSGSGTLDGYKFALETAKAKVSGPGLCQLNVTNNIDALVLGTGQVKHKGNTKTAQKKVYGAGSIERAY
jgi:hypothetical protein